MNQPVSTQDDQSFTNTASFVRRLLNGFAYLFEAILHRNVGFRYAESSGLMGVLGLIGFIMFWVEFNLGPLLLFSGLFLVSHAIQRVRARARRQNGDQIHSWYCGDSRLSGKVPFLNDLQIKTWLEPLLIAIAGILLCGWNAPMAWLLLIGALSIFLTNHMTDRRQQARIYAMHDALIENRVIAEQFRRWFGDGN